MKNIDNLIYADKLQKKKTPTEMLESELDDKNFRNTHQNAKLE